MALSMDNPPTVEEVAKRLIAEIQKERSIAEYRNYIGYMGREATLILGDERIPGRLISVDEQGGLWVEIDGTERRLTAAEVSVRI